MPHLLAFAPVDWVRLVGSIFDYLNEPVCNAFNVRGKLFLFLHG